MRRRTAWFLAAGVAAVAVGAAAVGALVLYSQGGRSPWARERYLLLRLQGELPEQPRAAVETLFESDVATVWSLVDSLDRAAADEQVSSVVLQVGALPDAGWAKVQELRSAVERFRRSGKPAYAVLEDAGNKEYYLATACSRIYAVPTALLDLTGLAVEITFFRRTLDALGIDAEFEGVGKYKSAPSRFTETGLTPADREQTEAVLDSLYEEYVSAVATARRLAVDEVRGLLDQGPFSSREAHEAGLVDELIYPDQLDGKLGSASRVGPLAYLRSEQEFWFDTRPKIALIYAVGDIVPGASREGTFPAEGLVGADTLAAALRRARADAEIRAVVLRVDSPGGVGTAADLVWREVLKTRETKPVVASLGDVAASGGYYVAMGGDAVVAQPGTLTGSIGVFSGKFVLRGLYDKLGIRREILSRGRHAGLFSDYRPWTAEERARIRSLNEAFYAEFVRKAAEGRRKSEAEVEAVAQGRVWTGGEALAGGLVDRLGGLADAVAVAKERARIPAGRDVAVVVLPERKGLLELLFERREDGLLRLDHGRSAAAAARWIRLLESRAPLARLPFDVQLR
jgi:protease-4